MVGHLKHGDVDEVQVGDGGSDKGDPIDVTGRCDEPQMHRRNVEPHGQWSSGQPLVCQGVRSEMYHVQDKGIGRLLGSSGDAPKGRPRFVMKLGSRSGAMTITTYADSDRT